MNMMTTVAMPIISAFCSPISERRNRSRPSWSVPRKWSQRPPAMNAGGRNLSLTAILVAERSVSSGNRIASASSEAKMTSPTLNSLRAQAARHRRQVGLTGRDHGRSLHLRQDLGRHQYSSLGSIRAAIRSTRMLITTKIVLDRIATPWMTGKSRCSTAWTVSSPMPG